MFIGSKVYRHHRGYRTVMVGYMPDRRVYRVTVWPQIEGDPFRLGHVHLDFPTYEECCAVGDRLAHPDCDGTCTQWPPDPRLVRPQNSLMGEHCPACGWPMQLITEVPRRFDGFYWKCQNGDYASFDHER